MMMPSIKMTMKQFFDSKAVMNAAEKARHGVLAQQGAFVRTTAKRLIRRRKGVSQPGQPPFSHEGTLRKMLFFARENQGASVIVGPAKTNKIYFDRHRRPVTGTVPQILEEGGSITMLEVQRSDGVWGRADLRSRRRLAGRPTRYKTVQIKARPYMSTALAKATSSSKWLNLWGDKVK